MASKELDRLKTSVTRLTTVASSTAAFIGGLAQQLRDAADDPAAINAIADEMDADSDALVKSVTDNTPAATP